MNSLQDHLDNAIILDRLRRSCDYIQIHYKVNPFFLKLLRENMMIFKIWCSSSSNFYRVSFWEAAKDTFIRMLEEDEDIEFLRHVAQVTMSCY